MFQVENTIQLLATAVVCSDAQDNKTDVPTYYLVAVKQINKSNYDNNDNGVFINYGGQNKQYYEIKESYIQRPNDGSGKECEVKLSSAEFDLSKINNDQQVIYYTDDDMKLKRFKIKNDVICFIDGTYKSKKFINKEKSNNKKKN